MLINSVGVRDGDYRSVLYFYKNRLMTLHKKSKTLDKKYFTKDLIDLINYQLTKGEKENNKVLYELLEIIVPIMEQQLFNE